MDTTKTMRELCTDEPLLADFLVAQGFPFSLENPIVDLVTFDDVCGVTGVPRDTLLGDFSTFKAGRL